MASHKEGFYHATVGQRDLRMGSKSASFAGNGPTILDIASVDDLAARVHAGDARDLMDVLPEGSVSKAFLLYPDPWPKARHHRRRFVTAEHLEPLHRVLAPGAEFRIATDIPDYVRQAMEEVPRAGFEWLGERAEDWRRPWGDWLSTRYEQKALREGRVPHYLTFRRR